MRFISSALSFIHISLAANINWSAPTTVFSAAGYDASPPQIAVNSTLGTATTAWITSSSGIGTVYVCPFDGSSWGSSQVIASSSLIQTSLALQIDSLGNQIVVWDALDGIDSPTLSILISQNRGNGWTSPYVVADVTASDPSLFLSAATVADETFTITWQDADGTLQQTTNLGDAVGSPSSVNPGNSAAIRSISGPTGVVFVTSTGVYSTLAETGVSLSDFTSTNLFTRSVNASSLALSVNADLDTAICVFQDQQSSFLISGIDTGSGFSYTTIAVLRDEVENVAVTLSPIDGLPAVIWELSNGRIQAAHFNGHLWMNPITLSSNGASPAIAINPITNHIVAVWADLTAGGTGNTIQSAEFNRFIWSSPQSLSAGGSVVSSPKISFDSNGLALVVWSRQATGDSSPLIEAITGL